jgi:hypothetical protein
MQMVDWISCSLCNLFCLNIVFADWKTYVFNLWSHFIRSIMSHIMIILRHVCHYILKQSIFKFAELKPNKKNL